MNYGISLKLKSLATCVMSCSLTVNKEGPNKGRPFYVCPKPKGQGCDYFSWAGENNDGSTRQYGEFFAA